MSDENDQLDAKAVMKQHAADCHRTFAEMKRLAAESSEAYRKARDAEEVWRETCRKKALLTCPELPTLMANVDRLSEELLKAKKAVEKAAHAAETPDLFRKWWY